MAKHKIAAEQPPLPPELKEMKGRGKGNVKGEARAALPNGSNQELADKGNEIAISKGYKPTLVADDFIEKEASTPRTNGQQVQTPRTSNNSPMEIYRRIREVLKAIEANHELAEFAKVVEEVRLYSEKVGGIESLADLLKD